MANIYLEIGDADSLMSFLTDAQRKGILKEINLQALRGRLRDDDFPIKVPVSTDGVLNAVQNPIIRKIFGKKIEETTKRIILEKVLGTG